MSYIPLSKKDIEAMLKRIGLSSLDELFTSIPREIRWEGPLDLPPPLTESELFEYFNDLSRKNIFPEFLSFLGAGAYAHTIPAVVDYLSSRGEFVTPYTPYQPEVSQGTLQIIFEYQTLICQLTGLEVANASLYEGATATAEAVLMAQRLKNKSKVLVARTLHPQYRQVIASYIRNLGLTLEEIDYDSRSGRLLLDDLKNKLDDQVTALVVQNPNFFGVIEEPEEAFTLARQKGALNIAVVTEALSLGLLQPPGKYGADIACGEGQSFGLPLSFGGPYLGFIACRQEFLRQLPGRIAGQTKDAEGRIGYVLTLSTREQHIRREKATSNICTNQAWCALRATIFLETLGPRGLKEMAYYNLQKANYALESLLALNGLKRRFEGPIFNEFVLESEKPLNQIYIRMMEKGIIAGYPLERDFPELKNCLLLCVTEVHSRAKIEKLIEAFKEALA
jgi:glycine dehydrogenase subunit 1